FAVALVVGRDDVVVTNRTEEVDQRTGAEAVQAFLACPVGRDEDSVEEVWGLSVLERDQTRLWISWFVNSVRESSTVWGFTMSKCSQLPQCENFHLREASIPIHVPTRRT